MWITESVFFFCPSSTTFDGLWHFLWWRKASYRLQKSSSHLFWKIFAASHCLLTLAVFTALTAVLRHLNCSLCPWVRWPPRKRSKPLHLAVISRGSLLSHHKVKGPEVAPCFRTGVMWGCSEAPIYDSGGRTLIPGDQSCVTLWLRELGRHIQFLWASDFFPWKDV